MSIFIASPLHFVKLSVKIFIPATLCSRRVTCIFHSPALQKALLCIFSIYFNAFSYSFIIIHASDYQLFRYTDICYKLSLFK